MKKGGNMSKPDLPDDYKVINHPMEEVLDIEQGSTHLPMVDERKSKATIPDNYDETDTEIVEQFQEIYDTAMDAYEQQANDISAVPPQFRARNQEVAAQYLNTALNAAKEKASLKMSKDKNIIKQTKGPQTINQNVIVADRNKLLKTLLGEDGGIDIDG